MVKFSKSAKSLVSIERGGVDVAQGEQALALGCVNVQGEGVVSTRVHSAPDAPAAETEGHGACHGIQRGVCLSEGDQVLISVGEQAREGIGRGAGLIGPKMNRRWKYRQSR